MKCLLCSEVIKEKGLEHVTVEDLVTEVTPKGRGTDVYVINKNGGIGIVINNREGVFTFNLYNVGMHISLVRHSVEIFLPL